MTTATVGIDPRIRARRVAVMRAEGRRRLRVVIAIVSGLIVVGAGWALTRSPALDIDRVDIEGVDGPAAELIRRTADVSLGTPLLDVDTEAIQARVESLPWVEQADVGRRWPGTIAMTVIERTPVAVVPSGTGIALLDESGVVVARDSGAAVSGTDDLPLIDVPLSVAVGDVHLDAAPGLAVASALTADLAPWVEAVRVQDGQVGLDLVGRAAVTMGPPVRLDDKVTAVRAVLGGVDLSCVIEVDVTAPDQTTVRRDPLCDAATLLTDSDA